MKKIILHLCADIGSDSRYYQLDEDYEVIRVGEDIGVENYRPPSNVHGIIANPPCTEFSTAKSFKHVGDIEKGMYLVNHCLRIINESNPKWWVLENPARGRLKEELGMPVADYQPWQFGSPWTKHTALWGNFIMPSPIYSSWQEVPKIDGLYIRNGRKKPGLVYLHKSAINIIPEFEFAREHIKCDADIRSMCSQGFAREFYKANR